MSIFTAEKPKLGGKMQLFIDKLDAMGGTPLYEQTPEGARQTLIDTQDAYRIAMPDVEIRDLTLNIGPTGKVGARLMKPRGAKDHMPCLFYVHGAGWVMGGTHTHDNLIRQLSVNAGVAVMFPVYTLSPEAQYPIPLEQCYSVLEYTSHHTRELGLDPDGFVICGDSVGGNMATVLAMLAKERGGPNIIAQILLYPVTDAGMDTKSYKEFADGPWLTKKSMAYFWNKYLPNEDRRKERNASPLQASLEELEGLPPTLIITNENDVLRDEAEEYARRLDKAGVEVANIRMNGSIHDFMMLNALADAPQTKAGFMAAVAAIKKAFQMTFPEA